MSSSGIGLEGNVVRMRTMVTALWILVASHITAHAAPAAVSSDPPYDPTHPPTLEVVHIPSHGLKMNGIILKAAGAGRHPVVLLLHGLPGNEQNLDLAQAIRRDGWSVLTFHYRGCWGSAGTYSFTHVFEDSQAAYNYMRDPAVAARYGFDTNRIVVIGHSLGGMAATIVGRDNPELAGVGLISAADFGAFGQDRSERARVQLTARMAENMESLVGVTPATMATEIEANATQWDFVAFAPELSKHPLLLVTSDDGLAGASDALGRAVHKLGQDPVTAVHLATDHSYSGKRIALETAVINWLDGLPVH